MTSMSMNVTIGIFTVNLFLELISYLFKIEGMSKVQDASYMTWSQYIWINH